MSFRTLRKNSQSLWFYFSLFAISYKSVLPHKDFKARKTIRVIVNHFCTSLIKHINHGQIASLHLNLKFHTNSCVPGSMVFFSDPTCDGVVSSLTMSYNSCLKKFYSSCHI